MIWMRLSWKMTFIWYIDNLPGKYRKKERYLKCVWIDKIKIANIALIMQVSKRYVSRIIKEMSKDFLKKEIP